MGLIKFAEDPNLSCQTHLAKSKAIRQGRELVQAFRSVLAKRQKAGMAEWEAKARATELKEFTSVLAGVQKDRVAV